MMGPANSPSGAWRRWSFFGLIFTSIRGRTRTVGWLPLVALLTLGVFSLLAPDRFPTQFNLGNIVLDTSVLVIMAIGQGFVIMTAGIDLSVGSILVLSSIVSGMVMLGISGEESFVYGQSTAGWGTISVGFFVAVLLGLACGLANGLLVAKLGIPPLIVTLGTMGVFLGSAQLLTNGQDIRTVPKLLVDAIGSGRFLGIPILILIATAVVIVAAVFFRFTSFGVHVLAVGSNREGTRRSGISVNSVTLSVYGISGALAGLAGILSMARFSTTTIGGHTADNLATISAVILGGTSLFGGVGTIMGTIIGAFIPSILLNGFIIQGIAPFWQTVAIGVILIVAVYIDKLKRRRGPG